MLHTTNVVKAHNYNSRNFGLQLNNDTEYDFFHKSTATTVLHVLCAFPRFGESGFGETGLNH